MFRLSIILACVVLFPSLLRADAFDRYTNAVLLKVPKARQAELVKKLTPDLMVKHSRVLKGIPATFLVVKTNGERMCRLLVQPARQKIDKEKSVPILLIERFTTYLEDEEKAVRADGKNVRLFADFHFDLDLGQIVPAALGGDLRFVALGDDVHVEPVGKAEIYVMTEAIPEATPKKLPRPEIGAVFEPRYFTGVYKLYDDGRRSGTLHLKVQAKGDVRGFYYSGKDGRKYEVAGKVGDPNHSISFRIMFPKTVQHFHGWLFTGDGRALVGSSRLQDRETGFYALREDD
ncbi:MAG: hypothetical protein FJ271_20040 [Planctomycetes bacterium]|nr:hypothetical protein [Planctomycetota bacterium]